MKLAEIIQKIERLKLESCDDDMRAALATALDALTRQRRGVCLDCGDRAAEISGCCRPCYQRERRSKL